MYFSLLLTCIQLITSLNYEELNSWNRPYKFISDGNKALEWRKTVMGYDVIMNYFNGSEINLNYLFQQIEYYNPHSFFWLNDKLAFIDKQYNINLIENEFNYPIETISYYNVGPLWDCIKPNHYYYSEGVLIYSCYKDLDFGDENEIYGDNGKLYKEFYVRRDKQWVKPKRKQQIYRAEIIINQDNKYELDGLPIDLLKFTELESPIFPFDKQTDFNYNEKRKELSFVATSTLDDVIWNHSCDVYTIDIEGYNEVKKINKHKQTTCSSPTYSKDGKYLAWLYSNNTSYDAQFNYIKIYDFNKKRYIDDFVIDKEFSIQQIMFYNEKLILKVDERGKYRIYLLDFNSNELTPIKLLFNVDNIELLIKDELILLLSSLNQPPEYYKLKLLKHNIIRISNITYDLAKNKKLNPANEYNYFGANNDLIHTFIIEPNIKSDCLLIFLHDNYFTSFKNQWYYFINPHIFSNCYKVFVNYHGSNGYGIQFSKSLHNNWQLSYKDILLALDNLLIYYPNINHNKACLLGSGFAGYIMNTLNSKSDRFACMLIHDGIFDLKMTYYTTDLLFYYERQLLGNPIYHPKLYDKYNLLNQVYKFHTPTFLSATEFNYHIDYEQSLANFIALQNRNVTSEFLLFRNESSLLINSSNANRWYYQAIEFLNNYLN